MSILQGMVGSLPHHRRRSCPCAALLAVVYIVVLSLALPVAPSRRPPPDTGEAPTGHDGTLTTIFLVALGIPLVLTVLTLIDIARGKHTQRHADH